MLTITETVRRLARNRTYAGVAIGSLALALAAATTVFSIVNALLLRPLAVEGPKELASIYRRSDAQAWASLSYLEYRDFAARTHSFSGLTAFTVPGLQASLREPGGEARATPIALVAGNYFHVLGLRSLRGRFFDAGEDRRDAAPIPVVVSESLWRARFGAANDIVGRVLLVNGQQSVIVGVMPRVFTGTFTALRTDVWLPLLAQPRVLAGAESLERRDSRFLNVIGRLRAGATRAAASTELGAIARQLEQSNPETDAGLGVTLTDTNGVPPFIATFIAPFLALMFGVVAMILLVACANLAGLSLAQAAGQRQDMALRMALGAGRLRLVLQSLVEAVLLSGAAVLLGMALTRLALFGLLRSVPELGLPVHFDVRFDVRVFTFALVLLASTAILFGVAPALAARRVAPMMLLREDVAGGRARTRARNLLLVLQIALSVVLLTGSVLLLRGLSGAARIDIGFDPNRVALLSFEPTVLGYDSVRRAILYDRLLARVSALPGVQSAALAMLTPLGPRGDQVPVVLPTRADTQQIGYNGLTPGFFDLLRIRLVRGRDFSRRDTYASPGVVIVSAAMARQFWPNADPLGQHISIRGHDWEVIGVVGDIKHSTVGEGERPFLYLPLLQTERARGAPVDAVLHARALQDPAVLLGLLPRELAALDADIPAQASLMRRDIQMSLFPARLAARIVGGCGLLALLLAIVGLHALSAYQAARRVREFGIRIALGAQSRDLARLVIGQSIRLTLIGLAIGVPLAVATGSLLRSLLFGVPPTDLLSYGIVALVLAAAVILAGWAPARRAVRTEPVAALKST